MIGQLADVVLVHMATLVAVNRQTLLIYRNKYFHEKTVIYRERHYRHDPYPNGNIPLRR